MTNNNNNSIVWMDFFYVVIMAISKIIRVCELTLKKALVAYKLTPLCCVVVVVVGSSDSVVAPTLLN